MTGNVATPPADEKLGIKRLLQLQERRKSAKEEFEAKLKQKRGSNERHSARIPEAVVGTEMLLRVGNTSKYSGPYRVTAVQRFDELPKRISDVDERDIEKTTTLKRVMKFCPRGDDFFERESSGRRLSDAR